jgi:hypothetical protein
MMLAYSVSVERGRRHWRRCGTATRNADGTLTIQFTAIPSREVIFETRSTAPSRYRRTALLRPSRSTLIIARAVEHRGGKKAGGHFRMPVSCKSCHLSRARFLPGLT